MSRTTFNWRTLRVIALGLSCITLALVWPQWRVELQAYPYPSDCFDDAEGRARQDGDTCRAIYDRCTDSIRCAIDFASCDAVALGKYVGRNFICLKK